MDAGTREQARKQTAERRRRPVKPQRIHFPVEGLGECVEVEAGKPLELCIEATDREGQIVSWLTDEWWIEVQAICRDRTVNVVMLPTPDALFDEVVRHQLEMLRRIAPKWSIVGYTIPETARHHPSVEDWIYLPYDEIRFYEEINAVPDEQHAAAEQLIAQAAGMPRVEGIRRSRLRIIHSLPITTDRAVTPQLAAHRPPQVRPLDQEPVEST